ncbi:DNA polymerase eta isoform X1 [Toxorhynchites rutilus septentrionalis]|uniref:DNA polymerase eta isoform X1 n=1 Tax=Toxorhynchites rutilus septentrionalis TaxID=329112 RepID=UPI00247A6ECC|nr:DNA polymerase eta isoform X1 [Toxorhynchites rutilus septentrionalis]
MSSKQFINIKNKYERIIVLVDMDCFYCQVEEKMNPEIRGKPIAVVQYNPWQGGGIIAVNYPARAKGVTRHMRGDEARQHCPDIILPQVPQVRGKADISKYRDAGKEVAAVLQSFTPLLERASVDEAYLDITERVLVRLREMNEGKFQLQPDKLANTFAVGYNNVQEFVQKISGDLEGERESQNHDFDTEEDHMTYKKSDIKLLIGASIVNEIRDAVKDKTGYECSAGIAHNKILAKLTAGFHKPNKQTILPLKSIPVMYQKLQIKKVKGLGGKLGEQVCELLKIQFMSELCNFSEKILQTHFDERMGSWMYLIARGIDLEAVTPKFNSKSIGCCKRFPGKNALSGFASLKHWLQELSIEIQERLKKDIEENNRSAKQITVSYTQQIGENEVASTRSVPLVSYEADKIAADALEAIKRNTAVFLKTGTSGALNNPIKFLGLAAGKFEEHSSKNNSLKEMFSIIASKASKIEARSYEIEMDSKDRNSFFQSHSTKSETCGQSNYDNRLQNYFKVSYSKDNENTTTSSMNEEIEEKCLMNEEIALKNDSAVEGQNDRDALSNPDVFLNSTMSLEDTAQGIITNAQAIDVAELNADFPDSESDNQTVDQKLDRTYDNNHSTKNYRETYVEYYRHTATPQVPQKQCPNCNKTVSESEYQCHLDFHLALEVSQKQREDYRSTIKNKFKSLVPKPKPKEEKQISQIDKFLTTTPVETLDSQTSRCPECGKSVPSAQMHEHNDYHIARKLQIEFNRIEMSTASSSTASIKTENSTRNKRKRPSDDKNKPVKVYNSSEAGFTASANVCSWMSSCSSVEVFVR